MRFGGGPHETHYSDCVIAIRIDTCNDDVRFREAGHGAHPGAGRHGDSGQGRTRPRAYGPRRPWPPLRMGQRPQPSLWLAPSSLTSGYSLQVAFAIHCPGDSEMQRSGRSRLNGAACSVDPGDARRVSPSGGQPKPISTAMRIRSEWFLAPSFCLSSDVVLATVL
jgi:hypothetical protein